MTSIVGILCKDGVVIGADSSVTFSAGEHRTIEQSAEKIEIFGEKVIIAGTGAIGLSQRFSAIVSDYVSKNKLNKGSHLDVAKDLCGTAIKDFQSTLLQKCNYGVLSAFPSIGKPYLCEFGLLDFQPEFKTEENWFASMGSVQHITDSFLAFLRSIFWENEQPNVNEGMFAAKWTLDHAVAVNAGGVNAPVRIAVLEKIGEKFIARKVPEEEIDEHQNMIVDIKTVLGEFMQGYKDPDKQDVPNVPRPDTVKSEKEETTTAGNELPNLKEMLDDGPEDQRTKAERYMAQTATEEEKQQGKRKRKR